jgi:hypothetical protein
MRNLTNTLNKPVFSISLAYFMVITSYFLNSKSRNALGEAKSSYLNNNLNAKITLIVSAYIIAVFLVAWTTHLNFQRAVEKNKSILKFAPLAFFVSFNALPAIIQSLKNISVLNIYYSVMQVGNTFPNFIDLKQTIGFLINSNVKNIGDEGLIYPTFILKLRFLNPFIESNFASTIIAYLTIISFAWMIFDFSRKLSSIQNLALSLLVISPPFLLLIDRQNIDCLLILLVYVSASIFGKSDSKSIFAIILITMASLIKIYPAIGLGYIVLTDRRIIIRMISLISLVVAIIVIYPDLISIQRFQVTDIAGSAGLPVLMAHLAGTTSAGFFISQSFILLCILLSFILIYSKNSIKFIIVKDNQNLMLVIFGSLILIETLMLSTNYLYRMSYILFLIPLIGGIPKRSFFNVSFLFFILGIYLSPRSTGLLINLFLFPFLILMIIFLFKIIVDQTLKINFGRENMPDKTNN